MSYIRKFQRKHILQELKQQEKKEKSNKRAWGYSALAAMTTISLLVPSMASAAVDGVVRSDGGVKDVTENRVDVYVGKMIDSNKTGVNTFSQFDVKANEVVNMHFNQKGGADVANNVINIVDSKINVSGTVNAIKNNKVGGNLYFLSSQGMAVTQSGVINAGSLHAFAPSSAEIQALKDDVAAGNAAVANKYIDYTVHRPNAGTMTSGPDSAYNVSLNPTGSIVVKGKINTYGDVGLHAANVQIGGTDSDATEKTAKGIITTGVTDFSSLVNVTNVEGSNLPTIDGNTGATELQAMQLGNGDIVLEARAAKQVADSTADPAGGEAANKLYIPFLGNLSSPDLLEKQSFNAKVTINGTLDAAQSTNGSIKVDAIARNESNTALVGVDATVDVVSGSVLHAKKDVDVKASALNIYIEKDNAKTKADFDPTDTGSGTGIDAIGPKALSGLQDLVALPKLTDASIAILNSNATVNIGTDAALTADTGDVSVGARSDLMTVMGPQKPTFLQRLADMITMPTVANAQLPPTGVTLLFGDNNATVNINGQLKATAGNVNVDSLARMDANAYNNNTQRSEISDSAKYNLSLTYADLANTSKVTVADTAKLTASQDVNVKARSIENVDTDVSINVNENAGLATVLNLTKFNSTTKTDFNGTTTGRNVTIASDRKVYELTATADASIGANDLYKQVARGFEAGSKGLLTSIKGALGSTGEDGQSPLSLGAAVGYYDIQGNTDTVIGSKAKIDATDDVTIKANSSILDTKFHVIGTTGSVKKKDAQTGEDKNYVVNVGVLYANVLNNAGVKIADGSTDEGTGTPNLQASHIQGNTVVINATSVKKYNRLTRLKQAVINAVNTADAANDGFTKIYDKLTPDEQALVNAYRDKVQAYRDKTKAKLDAKKWDNNFDDTDPEMMSDAKFYEIMTDTDLTTGANDLQVDRDALMAQLKAAHPDLFAGDADAWGAVKNGASVLGTLLEFIKWRNYGDFAVGTSASLRRSDSQNETNNSVDSIVLSGSVGIVKSTNEAIVEVGTRAITALGNKARTPLNDEDTINAGEVDIKAESNSKTVYIGGLGGIVPLANSSGDTSLGGTVAYQKINDNSLVTVKSGTRINAASSVNIDTKNTTKTVNVSMAVGTGKFTVDGSFGVLDGNAKALTLIDRGVVINSGDGGAHGIHLTAHNDADIVNFSGGAAWSQGSAVGMSLALNMVNTDGRVIVDDLYTSHNLYELFRDGTYRLDGVTENRTLDNSIFSAPTITVNAGSTGLELALGIAGSMAKESDGQPGIFSKIKKGFEFLPTALGSYLGSKVSGGFDGVQGAADTGDTSVDNKFKGSGGTSEASQAMNSGSSSGISGDNQKADIDSSEDSGNKISTSFSGAGSVAMNMSDRNTEATLHHVTVDNRGGTLSVIGRDNVTDAAVSGAIAIAWRSSDSGKGIGFGGAGSVNLLNTAVKAGIYNSTINNANTVESLGLSGGLQLAGAVGVAVSTNSRTDKVGRVDNQGNMLDKNGNITTDPKKQEVHEFSVKDNGADYTFSVGVPINIMNHDVTSEVVGSTITSAGLHDSALNVSTFEGDVQVAGAVGLSVVSGSKGGAAGAVVGVSKVKNTGTARLQDSTVTDIKKVDVSNRDAIVSVVAGMQLGVSTSGKGGGSNTNNIQGALAYNNLNSHMNAEIIGTPTYVNQTISGSTTNIRQDTMAITGADEVNVMAHDLGYSTEEATRYRAALTDGMKDTRTSMISKYDLGSDSDSVGDDYYNSVDMSGVRSAGKTDNADADINVNLTGQGGGNKIVTVAFGSALNFSEGKFTGAAGVAISDVDNSFGTKISGSYIKTNSLNLESAAATKIVNVGAGISVSSKAQFGGAASVAWQTYDSTLNSTIGGNSEISAKQVINNSLNFVKAYNIAGGIEASFGKKGNSGGIALAYSNANTSITSSIDGANIHLHDLTGTNPTAADVVGVRITNTAQNKADINTVGFNLAVSQNNNYSGVVALNRITNNVSASIGGSDSVLPYGEDDTSNFSVNKFGTIFSGVQSLVNSATDNSNLLTIDLSAPLGGGNAYGGGVAYTSIGDGTHTNTDNATQRVTASINKTMLGMLSDGTVTNRAEDNSKTVTIGIGVALGGGSGKTVSGGASIALLNKKTAATITDSHVYDGYEDIAVANAIAAATPSTPDSSGDSGDSDTSDTITLTKLQELQGTYWHGSYAGYSGYYQKANVAVNSLATNNSNVFTFGLAGAVGGKAIGAAVAVNRISQGTEAFVDNSTMAIRNLLVSATARPSITNVTLGGAAAQGEGWAIAGSFGNNIINNSALAGIRNNSDILAKGSVGVVAQSDELIGNYVGGIALGGNVSAGLSSSYNGIYGTTDASVSGSYVEAAGNDSGVTVKSGMKDSDDTNDNGLLTGVAQKNTFNATLLSKGRQLSTANGLVVDSSATHSIAGFMVAGAASQNNAIGGAVNVNIIDGKTTAGIKNSLINQDLTPQQLAGDDSVSAPDVSVKASDYTNSGAFVMAAAAASKVAVGVNIDVNKVKRTTSVDVTGDTSTRNPSTDTNAKATKINARDFTAKAVAKQGLSNFDLSAGLSYMAAVGGVATTHLIDGATTTNINKADINYYRNSLVNASQETRAFATNVGAAAGMNAGIGISVGVVKQNATVTTNVTDSTLNGSTNGGTAEVSADSTTTVHDTITSAGLSGTAGVAGTVMVNKFTQRVDTKVSNSAISGNRVDITAKNHVGARNDGGAGALGGVGAGLVVSLNSFEDRASVSVINNSNVTSGLNANSYDLNVGATTEHDISQKVANVQVGGVTVGANIMITSLNDSLSITGKDQDASDSMNSLVSDALDKANQSESFKNQGSNLSGLSDDEKNNADNIQGDARSLLTTTGGSNTQSGVFAIVSDSTLKSSGATKVTAKELNDVAMTGGGASGSISASAGASVGMLNVNSNNKAIVENSKLYGKTVNVAANRGTLTDDGIELNVFQGGVAGLGSVGASYAGLKIAGNTDVAINSATLQGIGGSDSTASVGVTATDTTKGSVSSYGINGAIGAAVGMVISKVDNAGLVRIHLNDSNYFLNQDLAVTANKFIGYNTSISANKNTSIDAYALGVGAGVVSGAGMYVAVDEAGMADLTVVGSKNTFTATENGQNIGSGSTVTLEAKNTSKASATAKNNGFGLASGQIAVIDGTNSNTATVTVDGGNTMTVGKVNLHSVIGTVTDPMLDLYGRGVGGSAAGFQVNLINADMNTASTVRFGQQTFASALTALNVNNENNAYSKMDLGGVSINGLIGGGTNRINLTGKNLATTQVNGGTLKSATITTNGLSKVSAKANGDGGSIVEVSPLAAAITNNLSSDARTYIGGTWNLSNGMTVSNNQVEAVDTRATSLKITAIGGSSVEVSNTISSVSDSGNTGSGIFFNNGTIVNADTLTAKSKVGVNYGKNIADTIEGLMVGLAGGNTTITSNLNITKQNTVSLGEGAQINTKNSQYYEAYSDNDISHTVNGKGAGLLEGTAAAKAITDITMNNAINNDASLVDSGNFATGDTVKGLFFGAYDLMKLNTGSKAKTPAGLVGVAIPINHTSYTRNNTVNMQAHAFLKSIKDIGLYSGADSSGAQDSLTMKTTIGAYNYTAIPISKMDLVNTLTTNNHINWDTGSSAQVVQHIKMKAIPGLMNFRKAYENYSWVTGQADDERLVTVDNVGPDTTLATNNYVQVNGNLSAGIWNQLFINVKGQGAPEGYTVMVSIIIIALAYIPAAVKRFLVLMGQRRRLLITISMVRAYALG